MTVEFAGGAVSGEVPYCAMALEVPPMSEAVIIAISSGRFIVFPFVGVAIGSPMAALPRQPNGQ